MLKPKYTTKEKLQNKFVQNVKENLFESCVYTQLQVVLQNDEAL